MKSSHAYKNSQIHIHTKSLSDRALMWLTSCHGDIADTTYQTTKDEECLVVDDDWWSPDPPVHSCSVVSGNLR